jgi:hypothetical protein
MPKVTKVCKFITTKIPNPNIEIPACGRQTKQIQNPDDPISKTVKLV